MELLDGKKVKATILTNLKEELTKIDKKLGLAVIQVGSDSASSLYVKQKQNLALELGFNFKHLTLDKNVSEESLINLIEQLNNNDEVDGILLQLPLPKHLDSKKITQFIDPDKDVDGLNSVNVKKLDDNLDGLVPCTALGIITLLKYYNIDVKNKNVVIIGQSEIVGKPVSKLLFHAGANITLCHSKTENILGLIFKADILIVAAGKKDLIKKDMVKDGVIIVDVGINRVDGKLYGDVDFLDVSPKCHYITPVPGGVGPMTIAMLGNNLLKAYHLKKIKNNY